ncbi:UNVERIFIED_CONTAM: LINE-1 retrotransposable element O protein [Sesamum radiatum]|uniref:LINE-1 retrotransposable element O protein n=1 Tax=Sesamum radiatum TaxID=300843 RepID=A0AAW2PIS9_SESRA
MGGVEVELDRMKRAWSLTDDDEEPILIPSGLWEANTKSRKLCLVDRLLSKRPYRHEALCSSLQSMFRPVKGLDVKQLDDGRILLCFNHIIDKQQALDGCPWSFEKNILILKSIGELENPMHVALDECDFFVHVHDLPLSMMNLGIATLIGNRIGSFQDLEADDTGCSWGATMRIRVSLNVHKPLKRSLKLQSSFGQELVVRFTYERLSNFCYLCGRLGHIDKYCEIRFDDGFRDLGTETPFRPWLRAPLSGANHGPTPLLGRMLSSRGFSQPCPPPRTGAAVFGNFRTPAAQIDPEVASDHHASVRDPKVGGRGIVEEVVESSPLADFRKRNGTDTVMLGMGDLLDVEARPGEQRERTGVRTEGHRSETDGIGVESEMDILAVVGDPIPQGPVVDLTLVNIPLQFTSQNLFSVQGSARRGCRPGRGLRGRPRKRSCGVPGLGSPWTVRTLKELIQLHKPGLVFLSETKCKARRCARVKELVNYYSVGVDSVGKGGGLILLWRKDVEVWLQSFSSHHIDATVKSVDCKDRWRFTGFYGYPEVHNRKLGWGLLRQLARQSTRPWICTRDFNEILEQHEKQGTIPRAQWQMRDFKECLIDCDLYDLGFQGDMFTWCNNCEAPYTVRARLDRALGNHGWSLLFPHAVVFHDHVASSDHLAVWIGLDGDDRTDINSRQRKWFCFEAAWTASPECSNVIRSAWESVQGPRSHSTVISKIRGTRLQLLRWNKASFGNIRRMTKELNDKVCQLQNKDITSKDKADIEGLRDAIESLARKEEIMWKQRAKALWLAAGDRNTSFFHAKATERRHQNEIKRINDELGNEVTHKEGIQMVVLSYFRSIFASTNPTPEAVDEVLRCVEHRVTHAMNESLTQHFTSEEVLHALKQMHPLKSPGPDGMSPVFFQKYWSIVGTDVCATVLDFLNNGSLDPLVNFTHIVLIPKCPSPSDMSQFRPISLCNVIYKLASKVLANRVKPFLDAIVSPSQAAFVLGRLITDNVLVAYELNHLLKLKTTGKHGLMSLKLDVSKAYDRVEWRFLEKAFSGMIRKAERDGLIQGVAVSRTAPPISHILFADDTLIYCHASADAIHCIQHILLAFEKASGLMINLRKSAVVFSRNVEMRLQQDLAGILGVEVVPKHDKYLGLPTVSGRSKKELFASIKDRME